MVLYLLWLSFCKDQMKDSFSYSFLCFLSEMSIHLLPRELIISVQGTKQNSNFMEDWGWSSVVECLHKKIPASLLLVFSIQKC